MPGSAGPGGPALWDGRGGRRGRAEPQRSGRGPGADLRGTRAAWCWWEAAALPVIGGRARRAGWSPAPGPGRRLARVNRTAGVRSRPRRGPPADSSCPAPGGTAILPTDGAGGPG
ncbi:hypothetical protein NDU88_004233 [Pleurodeles waltl]|uniref:Uncharacterized protein n=1 Tax=Pleurodeles waltl TaxID=8319 RepID=A0AAV7TS18_PLEWA|nr:hypothetical protein NDU88_004233 [Pleurodeles waltl]